MHHREKIRNLINSCYEIYVQYKISSKDRLTVLTLRCKIIEALLFIDLLRAEKVIESQKTDDCVFFLREVACSTDCTEKIPQRFYTGWGKKKKRLIAKTIAR
jgi:hypothetical protein